jgi:hypothetical protein
VFTVVLLYRAHQAIGFTELDELRNTER